MKRRRSSTTIPAPPPIGSSLRVSMLRLLKAIGPRPEHRMPETGVRYSPIGSGSLLRALSVRGPGHKHYLARFPDGESLRITATRRREFADLAPPMLLPAAREAVGLISPGSRAVVLHAGTGWAADLVAQATGPAGGVIGLDADDTSVVYARLRYKRPQLGFEHGGIEAISAEQASAFDAALVVSPQPDETSTIRELARVVRPDGLIIAIIDASDALRLAERLRNALPNSGPSGSSAVACQTIGPAALIVARPGSYPPHQKPEAT